MKERCSSRQVVIVLGMGGGVGGGGGEGGHWVVDEEGLLPISRAWGNHWLWCIGNKAGCNSAYGASLSKWMSSGRPSEKGSSCGLNVCCSRGMVDFLTCKSAAIFRPGGIKLSRVG